MASIKEILMKRDGMSEINAESLIDEARSEINECLAEGGGYEEVEEIMIDYFGLEIDYIWELI